MNTEDRFSAIGMIRSALGHTDPQEQLEAKALLINIVRNKTTYPDEASVVYLADACLPRELYTQTMRNRVTDEDADALLAFRLDHFTTSKVHHVALVNAWWGSRHAEYMFNENPVLVDSPVERELTARFGQYLYDSDFRYFEVGHWHRNGEHHFEYVDADGHPNAAWGEFGEGHTYPYIHEEMIEFFFRRTEAARLERGGSAFIWKATAEPEVLHEQVEDQLGLPRGTYQNFPISLDGGPGLLGEARETVTELFAAARNATNAQGQSLFQFAAERMVEAWPTRLSGESDAHFQHRVSVFVESNQFVPRDDADEE